MVKLEAQDLSVRLGDHQVLSQVSLTLEPGELVFLLGLNGAGKSTLLRALAGLQQCCGGEVWCGGRPVSELSAPLRARRVALLHQHTPACHMTVEEYVMLGAAPELRWGAVPGAAHRARCAQALERLDLLPLRDRGMDQVSGGERQRAALAQCLMTNAPLLLLDEPTASLDVRRTHEFLDLLAGLVVEGERGALVSVHDPNLAVEYAGRVAVLWEGRVRQVGRGPGWTAELEGLLQRAYTPALACTPEGFFRWKRERSE